MIPDCSNHPKDIAGITDMRELAEKIGDLHYESLSELLRHLELKFYADSRKDSLGGRQKIATKLMQASFHMEWASKSISKAYKISKPFMQNKNEL